MRLLKLFLAVVLFISFSVQSNNLLAQAQFGQGQGGNAVIVFDGDGEGRSFKVRRPSKNNLPRYPLIELGNSPVFQESASAAKMPTSAPEGYYVVFSIGDDIGGRQAQYFANGITYEGIWRVIKPISRADFNQNGELIIPEGIMLKDRLIADYIVVFRADSLQDPISPRK